MADQAAAQPSSTPTAATSPGTTPDMAPPPPASTSLKDRLIALAQTLQFAWFCGHVTLLLCTLRYSLSYLTFNSNSSWARFSYRTAFVAAAATYGIVVYKAYMAKMKAGKTTQQQNLMALAFDENVQYLGMALVWLISKQIALAILPFTVYSLFHVAGYIRGNLLPALYPPQAGATAGAKTSQTGLSDTIGRFVKEYYDSSMTLVAVFEIFLWFRLLGSAILFQSQSWILLILYTMFLRVRYSQNSFVQGAVSQLTARADAAFANQSTPPAVRGVWEQLKAGVRRAVDATDMNRAANKASAPKTQ